MCESFAGYTKCVDIFYVHVTVLHRNKSLCNKNELDAPISQIYFVMKIHMFRTVLLSIIRRLLTVHSAIGADKSLVRPGKKQATVTENFNFHISYL